MAAKMTIEVKSFMLFDAETSDELKDGDES